jgi:hypothetical protein
MLAKMRVFETVGKGTGTVVGLPFGGANLFFDSRETIAIMEAGYGPVSW